MKSAMVVARDTKSRTLNTNDRCISMIVVVESASSSSL